jgi:putative hydrolase of the HAD superfamily
LVHGVTRSCDIGVMKPEAAAYRAALAPLTISADEAVYVGNGSSDELAGAVEYGFARVVHCNVFDRDNGLVNEPEQRRRAGHSDVSVDTIPELGATLDAWL